MLNIMIYNDDFFFLRDKSCQRGLPKMGRKKEHAEIGRIIKEIVSETRQNSGLDIKFEIASEDAKRILKEAEATMARQKPKKELQ